MPGSPGVNGGHGSMGGGVGGGQPRRSSSFRDNISRSSFGGHSAGRNTPDRGVLHVQGSIGQKGVPGRDATDAALPPRRFMDRCPICESVRVYFTYITC